LLLKVNLKLISDGDVTGALLVTDDKYDVDIFLARQLVSEKLQSLDLVQNVKPVMGPISTGLGEIFHYSIEAKNPEKDTEKRMLQLMELRSLQDWFIKPRLLSLKGVTEVNTIGGYEKQFFIQPNINKMAKYGIHFDDIENAIERTNINVGGGYIQQTGEQVLVRGLGLLQNISDIKNVVVKRLSSYQLIKIKDIAEVKFDKEQIEGSIVLGKITDANEKQLFATAI